MKQNKKVAEFTIQELLPVVITFVVIGIAISVGLNVQETNRASLPNPTATSAAWNASGQAILGTATIANNLTLIATVVVAAIVIGILVRYLMGGM